MDQLLHQGAPGLTLSGVSQGQCFQSGRPVRSSFQGQFQQIPERAFWANMGAIGAQRFA
jgi:hypothetical protein